MFNFLKNIFKRKMPIKRENEETKREVRSGVEVGGAELAKTLIKELQEIRKSTGGIKEEIKKEHHKEIGTLREEMKRENEETKREVRKMASGLPNSTHIQGHQIII